MSSHEIDTRTRILEAVCRLLHRDPAQPVRMVDVAEAAGISRQAVYLHFPTRADLMVAAVRWVDDANDVDTHLAASRKAATGRDRLDLFIEAWGGYIPEVYGVIRALMAMKETDAAAAAAWDDRMAAVRHGCAAAVKMLRRDGDLAPGLGSSDATDILWTLLSVRVWEHLRHDCGWSQARYISGMKRMARASLTG